MRLCLAAALLLAAIPALAQPVPLLDHGAWSGLKAADRVQAERFLLINTPRAFAVGPDGAFGWQGGGRDMAEVERRAIESCERRSGGLACRVAARDLSVVVPGRNWAPPEPPAGMRLSSMAHETVPDARMLWWGPERAEGVLVWAHGRGPNGADSRGGQPQGWVRHFNNAGFDVWRFDRHPATDDPVRAAGWLRADLAELRRRGYRRVVMAGQSRGGWNTLMALDTPGLVDAAIAIAPSAHGDLGGPNHLRQLDDLRGIVAGAAGAGRVRLAVANFREDPYDAEPEARGALFRQLGARAGGFLFLDRPEGLTGHGAGASFTFNERFGACLLRFATSATAPSGC